MSATGRSSLAYLLYLPLLPIGVVAVGLGFLDRWRLRGTPRGLILIGLASVLSGSWWMVGRGASVSASAGDEVSLLHWNVLWGGYWKSGQASGSRWSTTSLHAIRTSSSSARLLP